MHDPASPSDRPELGALDRLVGYHLRRASAMFAGDFARTLAGTGMRQVLFGILSIVRSNAGINQGNVGRLLGIQRANMVALINELVDGGLLARVQASDDRRAFALTLTDAGQTRLDECLALIERHEAELLGDLSASEQRQLVGLLARIEARER